MASSPKRYLTPEREKNFPYLTKDLYEVVGDATNDYNCIALAAGDKTRWWWPDPGGDYYWPISRRESTVECFIEAFESLNYEKCKCSLKKKVSEKVALYYDPVGCVATKFNPEAPPESPTHAAKQLPNGFWISKLGGWEEIQHKTLKCLNGTDVTG
jgi:hypothetical protein